MASVMGIRQLGDLHLGTILLAPGLTLPRATTNWEICDYD